MKICVYGSASNAIDPIYLQAAEELGKTIVRHGHSMVFGGGRNGVMGGAARGVRAAGGYSLGITPRFFMVDGELSEDCEMIYTDNLRERKKLLEESSDAFVIGPGGVGTFDEFFEVLTLRHLGRHSKPIVVYNVNGWFNTMDALLREGLKTHFISPETISYEMIDNAEDLVSRLDALFVAK